MKLTASDWDLLEELLPEARGLAPEQLEGFLDRHCAGKSALRAELEALLDADESDGFLEAPVGLSVPPGAADMGLPAGTTLGVWRIQQRIGMGGMGEVYAAERADGRYEGRAAIKLLHGHLASASLQQRFAREGQILGRLSHPNIARLLDAGAAKDGRPFLVLEYVDGQRLDHYCDARGLGIRARIALFLQICEAVAHAHAHLIVHRDLKPPNIIVNTAGQVKLLDFGIAKLVEDEQGAGATELTRLGGRPLTPAYAAPEQIRGEAVTTATDIYSLGVLLYELLCGVSPYGPDLATTEQLERAVLETQPQAPSRAARDPALAGARNTSARRLCQVLSGDLDTIAGKALDKEPGRRYASVLTLAEDLQRYLRDEPIAARRPSLAYRAGKFASRHTVGLAAAVAVVAALAVGVTGTVWQAQRAQAHAERAAFEARRAERQAATARAHSERVQRTKDFFVSIFQAADPTKREDGAAVTVVHALEDALKRIDTQFSSDPAMQGSLLDDFGEIKAGLGDVQAAKALFLRALSLKEKALAADDPALANTLVNLGTIEDWLGNTEAGRPRLMRAVSILEQHAQSEGDALANARAGLANVYMEANELQAATVLARQALAYYREHPGPRQMRLGIALGNMGVLAERSKRYAVAADWFNECVHVIAEGLGPESANLIHCLSGRIEVALKLRDAGAAVASAERAQAIAVRNLPDNHHWSLRTLALLGRARLLQGRRSEGESMLREALSRYEERPGEGDKAQWEAYIDLVESRERAGSIAEALAVADAAAQSCEARQSPTYCPRLRELRDRLASAADS